MEVTLYNSEPSKEQRADVAPRLKAPNDLGSGGLPGRRLPRRMIHTLDRRSIHNMVAALGV
jgi:hypothetical protein